MRAHRLVEGAAAAPSAEDEEHGFSFPEAVFGAGAARAAREQLFPHGRAHASAVCKAAGGLFEGGEDELAAARREAGRKPRGKVALVREGGDVQAAGGEEIGKARVSPLGKDEVGLQLVQKGEGAPLRLRHAEGQREVFGREAAHKFGAGDAVKKIARLLCEPFFDAAAAPRIAKAALAFKFLHDGEVGHGVPRAPSAAEEDVFHPISICRRTQSLRGSGEKEN